MRKKILTLALAALLVLPVCFALPVSAAERINALASRADWSVFEENNSLFSIEDSVLSVTPTDTDAGALYTVSSYSSAEIEFRYRVSYDPSVDPYSEEDGALLPGSFWGIVFGNEVEVGAGWEGVDVLPWEGRGGHPYMLCFDTERQTTDPSSPRYAQVGLSVRRYSEAGGHDYAARWSTVEPGTFDYVVSNGGTAHSLEPAYAKPVPVSKCFDTQEHAVKLEYHSEYKAQGDEHDAVVINVWFDEELVLTVVDEMPIQTTSWGLPVEYDKRGKTGYVSVFAHHASVSDVQLYDWEVTVSDLYISGESVANPVRPGGGGQTGLIVGLCAGGAVLVAGGTAAGVLVAKKKRRSAGGAQGENNE